MIISSTMNSMTLHKMIVWMCFFFHLIHFLKYQGNIFNSVVDLFVLIDVLDIAY